MLSRFSSSWASRFSFSSEVVWLPLGSVKKKTKGCIINSSQHDLNHEKSGREKWSVSAKCDESRHCQWDMGSNVTQLNRGGDTGTAAKTHPATLKTWEGTLNCNGLTQLSVNAQTVSATRCKWKGVNNFADVCYYLIPECSVLLDRQRKGSHRGTPSSICATLRGVLIVLPRGSAGTRSAAGGSAWI